MDETKPGAANTAVEIEEYDYTAQSLLQASPPEKRHVRNALNNTFSGVKRFLGEKFKILASGLLCFLLSYGTLYFLKPRTSTWLYQLNRNNILLMLLAITVISCLLTIFIGIWGKKMKPRQRKPRQRVPQNTPARKTASPPIIATSAIPEAVVEVTPTEKKVRTKPKASIKPLLKPYDIEERFHFSLHFLLRRKLIYSLQQFTAILATLFCTFWALSHNDRLFGMTLFASIFLLMGLFFLIFSHNQYIQSIENLFQNMLQQIYQYSSPTNSYNQLNAVNMLYALAFTCARHFQKRVLIEFQNILKLTRSSWYQTQYSNSPSILVEEVLRKLLSAVDFSQLLFGNERNLLREFLYHRLFLKHFQSFRSLRDQVEVSLLSQMSSNRKPETRPHFVLENYYLVGVNLSNLRIKEAHFQNCQLSHSSWSGSDISDCSISSCRFDQVILYRSNWRRFLWTANTAREIDADYCFFLQGNFKYCNLQGIESGNQWKMQHCLLQECDLSHSRFCLDSWENVQASACNWATAGIVLRGQLYTIETENLAEILASRLQIKT